MDVVEDYQYFVRYEVESWLSLDSEGEGYVTKIYGSILCMESEDDDGLLCGHVRLTHLRCNDMVNNDDYDPRGWGKSDTEEMSEITRATYRRNGTWSSVVEALWGKIDPIDLLVISEIELAKKHRGKGVGLQVASNALRIFGTACGGVALCPWPTEVDDPSDEKATKNAHVKLAKYSERLGFKRLSGTDIWFRSLVHEIDREEN